MFIRAWIKNLITQKKRLTSSFKLSLLICLLFSFVLHTVFFITLRTTPNLNKKEALPIQVTYQKTPPRPDHQLINKEKKKIVETPMKKTTAPKHSAYLGQQDHRTKKETKLKKEKLRQTKKGLDAKKKSSPSKIIAKPLPTIPPSLPKQSTLKRASKKTTTQHTHRYQALLAESLQALQQQALEKPGFQEYIDDDLAEGDAIDLNTTEYRYIGYFITLRKAIEMAWIYPKVAALQGKQGKVRLVFTIEKDGSLSRLKVTQSSGYKILDQSILQAIRMASPFAPLPATFDKDALTITGAFVYILNNAGFAY